MRAARDIQDSRLRVVDRHALLVLATYADNQTGDLFPGEEHLLRALACSRSAMYERLRRLEQLGYLTSNRRRGQVSLRRLHIPMKSDASDVRLPGHPEDETSGQPNTESPVRRTPEVQPAGLPYVEEPQEPQEEQPEAAREPELSDAMRKVLEAVTDVGAAHDCSPIKPDRVRRLCDEFPAVNLDQAAASFRDWWIDGPGEDKKLSDPCRAMRNWLAREKPGQPAAARTDFTAYDQHLIGGAAA